MSTLVHRTLWLLFAIFFASSGMASYQHHLRDEMQVPLDLRPDIQKIDPIGHYMREQILNELLNQPPQKGLNYPPLPRNSFSIDYTFSKGFTWGLGISWFFNKLGVGAKSNQSRKRSRKATLTLIHSLPGGANNILLGDDTFDASEQGLKMGVLIEREGDIYPNVSPDHPMIGMCTFDLSFNRDRVESIWGDLMGSGASLDQANSINLNYSLYSQFFQVDGKIPFLDLFNKYCDSILRNKVQVWMEAEFGSVEKAIVKREEGECNPSSDIGSDSSDGDVSCRTWFHTFAQSVQTNTIARCIQRGDKNFCELKARGEHACSLYWNSRTDTFSPEPPENDKWMKATYIFTEMPCDEKGGYRCEMFNLERVNGRPFFHGPFTFNPSRAKCTKH